MNSIWIGIIIGLFLYFAGERFVKVAVRAFKQRKDDAIKGEAKKMQEMIDKAMEEYNNKG